MVEKFIESLANHDNVADGDYTSEDGILMCGKCNTPKRCWVKIHNADTLVPCTCSCREEELAREAARLEKEAFKRRIDILRGEGVSDPAYLKFLFENDDYRDKALSDACRKYVDVWDEMRKENIGILLHGSVGTGKTFFACAIANALLEKCTPVCVTNFSRLLNKLQSGFSEDRQKLIDRLSKYELLVIDDLGVERDTSYAVEQVFNIIDARARAGKPLIITTNLSIEDLKAPPSLAYSRIYDRILEMCPITLKMAGKSRRAERANTQREKAIKIFKNAGGV